jgi:hypothetical protein
VISAIQQKQRPAVVEILDFMRKRGLTLNDLIQTGGEDLKSSNPKRVEKARRVEKCWELMARLSVKFADFLTTVLPPKGCGAIVTNPPYQIATEFARHALDLTPRVYLLLRLAFLESERRTDILEHRGLARVHVFRKRLPMMHRDGWNGPRASSAIPFGWFCWNRDYRGLAIISRIGPEIAGGRRADPTSKGAAR